MVEAPDLAIERDEVSTSLQGRPNFDEVLPAGVGSNKLAGVGSNKRSIRNSLLPLFLSVGRKLGYINPDRGITCPSGKSLQEFLVAFNQALFLVDLHDKTKKKSTRAKGKGDGRCTAL